MSDASKKLNAEQKRKLQLAHSHGKEYCIYPDCSCPFDHPGTPGWCAVGLPEKTPNLKHMVILETHPSLVKMQDKRDLFSA